MQLRRLAAILSIAGLLLSAQTLTPQPGRVAAHIVDSASNAPVADVRITLEPLSGVATAETYSAVTDANGHLEISNVPPGEYFVRIVTPRRYQSRVYSFQTFVVTAGKTTDIPVRRIDPSGSVEGIVLDQEQRPVAGASVQVLSRSVNPFQSQVIPSATAVTQTDGRYFAGNVAPGRHWVRIMPSSVTNGQSFAPTYYPNYTDRASSITIEVEPGEAIQNIDFTVRMTPSFHIRGRVVGITGKGERRTILVNTCDAEAIDRASIDTRSEAQPDGIFDIPGILPGAYCIVFDESSPGGVHHAHARADIHVTTQDLEAQQLTASPPVDIDAVLEIDQAGSGKAFELNLRLPARVDLIPAGNNPIPGSSGNVDPDNLRFTLRNVLADSYRISVPLTPPLYVQAIRYGTRDVTDGPFNPLGESAKLTIRIAAAKGRLRGRVLGVAEDDPPAVVTVAPEGIHRDQSERKRILYNTVNGRFEFNDLPPGTYRVDAWQVHDERLTRNREFLALFPTAIVTVGEIGETTASPRLITAQELEQAKARF